MGNIFSEKVRCSCGNLAVYRCKINLQDYKQREKFYYNHPEMEAYWRRTYFGSGERRLASKSGEDPTIHSDEGDTRSEQSAFASGERRLANKSGGGKIEESFISCSVCMKEKHASLFTHCPGGWVEEEYEHPSYEEMGVLLST
ncbi:Hypothetical protein ZAZAV_558 [Cedratvirus Zaza IHUMI]|uniref:Uncharacterized protein n=1 Tax=Cedratvirus Zaza IHUMI TaxID=2126979 RepID=A0A2R8FFS4_9VIRU|nr:Hypothetical protein ZAZAV_558 [Cedratvirus Zaza IHUMI]